MKFVIGGRGRLGQALAGYYRDDRPCSVERAVYQGWWQEGSEDEISRFFEKQADEESIVFVTSGILDPALPMDEHLRVNYLLPRNIIKGATAAGLKVVTFGTIMESIVSSNNPYIQSKAKLGAYVREHHDDNEQVLHIRIHTLYGGGLPSPFMFLGQILHSLVNKTVFEMTPGNQLREYHHIDDDVVAIDAFVRNKVFGVVELSHGEAVSLKDIALSVFNAFNAEDLLRIGALPEPRLENYVTVFNRHELLKNTRFRETLPAIVAYMKSCAAQFQQLHASGA